MGCEYELIIQVLYGNKWVNIVYFGTKTGCGGYPLCAAPVKLKQAKGIEGNYHADEPFALMQNEVLLAMGLEPKKNDGFLGGRIACTKEYNTHEEHEPKEDENIPYLYYSMDEFKQLIQKIPINPHGDPFVYIGIMQPVPQWMEMAKTAYPHLEEIWMSDETKEQEKVISLLIEKQKLLAKTYSDDLVTNMKYNKFAISEDLIRYIAEFASPKGSDVRIAWNDIEGNCVDISKDRECTIC